MGLLVLGSVLVLAVPASATCVTYGPRSAFCADAQAGTPTVGNDGDVCVDSLCPSVETNSEFCVRWIHNGNQYIYC